jgi:hypothetical protein
MVDMAIDDEDFLSAGSLEHAALSSKLDHRLAFGERARFRP